MRPRSDRELKEFVRGWNKKHPVGAEVVLKKDSGEVIETRTTSAAWLLSGNSPVINLDGITGCYLLDRVQPR